jgi:hypothetical protein
MNLFIGLPQIVVCDVEGFLERLGALDVLAGLLVSNDVVNHCAVSWS